MSVIPGRGQFATPAEDTEASRPCKAGNGQPAEHPSTVATTGDAKDLRNDGESRASDLHDRLGRDGESALAAARSGEPANTGLASSRG